MNTNKFNLLHTFCVGKIQIILLVLIDLPKNHEFSIFHLHNYLFIICDMITYNLGKVNHVTKWFSNLYPQFHSDGLVSICSPHESFILPLSLENNNLVILIVLNFIPDSIKALYMGTVSLLQFENHWLHLLARLQNTALEENEVIKS